MQKFRTDRSDQEIIEALALGAFMILDMVAQKKSTEKTPADVNAKSTTQTDGERSFDSDR